MSGRGVPRIYETIAKTEIGRKFERSRREPSLNNGVTLATFQASGNTPEELLRLKTVVSEFEIAEAALLRKQPSAPSNLILAERDWTPHLVHLWVECRVE